MSQREELAKQMTQDGRTELRQLIWPHVVQDEQHIMCTQMLTNAPSCLHDTALLQTTLANGAHSSALMLTAPGVLHCCIMPHRLLDAVVYFLSKTHVHANLELAHCILVHKVSRPQPAPDQVSASSVPSCLASLPSFSSTSLPDVFVGGPHSKRSTPPEKLRIQAGMHLHKSRVKHAWRDLRT